MDILNSFYSMSMNISRFIKVLALFIGLLAFISNGAFAQKDINPQDTVPISLSEKRFNEKYERNIKKARINGVYIPNDLSEAFEEIKALSKPESIENFKNADADLVVKRLHYSLGRWIIVNWNLYEGSRIGHHLKTFGVSHPDDQARFLLYTFHNHLNNLDLNTKGIAEKIQAERQLELESRKDEKF